MTKPNLKEIDWAISDLEEKETSENRYILLAALHICRDHMMGNMPEPRAAVYSEPEAAPLEQYGDSEFLQAISGKRPAEAWAVMDELMDTLRVVNPRTYDSVMRKMDRL